MKEYYGYTSDILAYWIPNHNINTIEFHIYRIRIIDFHINRSMKSKRETVFPTDLDSAQCKQISRWWWIDLFSKSSFSTSSISSCRMASIPFRFQPISWSCSGPLSEFNQPRPQVSLYYHVETWWVLNSWSIAVQNRSLGLQKCV